MAELILLEILARPAERRRGRHNPRVVKRKMSNFPTRARAAPAPRHVFHDADHIRIVAPVSVTVAPPRGETRPPALPQRPRRRTTRSPRQHTIWRAHIRAWRASHLPRHAYCQTHGLAPRSFNAWVTRLRHAFRRTRKDCPR
jgi:hypothetical protein